MLTTLSESSRSRVEAAILGAGPAGIAAALRLGQLGVRDVVLVDRNDFPRDKTCGSAVSPKGIEVLRQLGVWENVASRAYEITGLRLVTPAGRELYISGGKSAAAIVCCRRTLDHLLLEQALARGIQFQPKFYAESLIEERGRIHGFRARDGRIVEARYTVVANGAHSTFTVQNQPKRIIQAIMGWWEDVPFRPNHVEMVLDPTLLPLYGWLFPENDARVNIGICYEDKRERRNARTLFQHFLNTHYRDRLANARAIGTWKGHPISYSFSVGPLTSPGRVVIGEAGRMTHPATAEGIYQGMLSGIFVAEALSDIIQNRASEISAWAAYEQRCRKAFDLSFQASKLWRGLVRTPLLDWIGAIGARPAVRKRVANVMAKM